MLRYIYLRNNQDKQNTNHGGVVCLGYKIEDDNTLVIGISFCSPNDMFSKKIAHRIIEGRVKAGKNAVLHLPVAKPKYEEVVNTIGSYIKEVLQTAGENERPVIAGVKVPRWAFPK